MFRLVGGHRHHSNVGNHVALINFVEHKSVSLIASVEDVHQFAAFPDRIGTEQEVLLVRFPVHVADAEVVVAGHFERATALVLLSGLDAVRLLEFGVERVHHIVIGAHCLIKLLII